MSSSAIDSSTFYNHIYLKNIYKKVDLDKDLVVDGETYGSVIWETLWMDMVERILQQLESDMDETSSER